MEEVFLERLSRRTGISLNLFREVCGLVKKETCRASTIREARLMYCQAEHGSNAEISALNRWNTLSLQDVRRAKTFIEALSAHTEAPDDSLAKQAALKKCLLLAENAVQAKHMTMLYLDKPELQIAVQRWIELANSIDELAEAYKYASAPNQRLAIQKMIQVYKTKRFS